MKEQLRPIRQTLINAWRPFAVAVLCLTTISGVAGCGPSSQEVQEWDKQQIELRQGPPTETPIPWTPAPPPTVELPVFRFIPYTIQPNDTLSDIARRYGLSLQTLLHYNPQITDINRIQPNQVITVTTMGDGSYFRP